MVKKRLLVKASLQGIERAEKALVRLGCGTKANFAKVKRIGRSTVTKFFNHQPVQLDSLQRICEELTLPWQEIVEDFSGDTEAESKAEKQPSSSNIDALVQKVRSHCCEAILDNYSKIRLLDDTRIDIDLLYVDVYVLEKLSSKRPASISGLLEGVEQREDYERLTLGQQQERLPGQKIVQEFPRLMVLGKPGSGKTTFLRHLAVDCSKGKFFCDRIPVLIELRAIKEGNSFNLLNLIHREFRLAEQEQTQQLLNQGKAFILLDGLDEVPSQLRQSVRDQIYEFAKAKEYHKNRFVLTCRTQTTEYIADHFQPIEVADFDPKQVRIFARNWFTAIPETSSEAEDWTSRFVKKLEENKQIRELAVTPILLSLTCLLFTAEQDLPTKQSELYEKGINLFLKRWDRFREIPRDYQQLSISDKRKLLSYLAFLKFEQHDNFILFEQDEIEEYIAEYLGIDVEESEAILRAIEAHHGLLIERAQGFWSFSHLTFQEYFAAKYIVDSPTPEEAFQSLVTHITEPPWREVFLLTVQMLDSTDNLLQLMKREIDTFIATDERLQQFLTWVHRKSLDVKDLYKPLSSRAFYVDLTRSHKHSFALTQSLVFKRDPMCAEVLAFIENPHHIVVLSIYRAKLGDALTLSKLNHYQGSPLLWDFALIRALRAALQIEIDCNPTSQLSFVQANTRTLIYSLEIDRTLIDSLKIEYKLEPELQLELQKRKNQLSEIYNKNQESLLLWWQENGQVWIEQLREVMFKYRKIRHDWQFSNEQKELLQKYYDANKLLVDCLNSDCHVSREVRQEIEDTRQEIEDTLLLPMSEIEKRQQGKVS